MFINGNNFKKLANICIDLNNIKKVDKNILKKSKIIFIKTDIVKSFFEKYYEILQKDIIIITHNSDYHIDKNYLKFINLPKIKNWYGQNCKILSKKLISIPIGIANLCWKHGNQEILKEVICIKNKKDKLLYVNFNFKKKIRIPIMRIMKKKGYIIKNAKLSFKDYLIELSKHKFCISPPGKGIDCHRHWESLYLGTIPIIKKDIAFEQFNNLPILFIDNWNQINNDFLEKKYQEFQNKKFNYDKIYMDYWIKNIK